MLDKFRSILYFKSKYYSKVISKRFRTRTILTFPENPHCNSILYKICCILGYRIVQNVNLTVDLIINWEDCTHRRPSENLTTLGKDRKIININCLDISKNKVDRVHKAIFGYGLSVDARTCNSLCVKKSDLNAKHDGAIVRCPIDEPQESFVYHRLINNSKDEEFFEDIRIPVFGSTLPFCYFKRKLRQRRFSNQNFSVSISSVEDLLSRSEIECVLQFCQAMGLDYGEVDALRDADNDQLFVIDVNSTPYGPPNHLGKKNAEWALDALASAFVKAFFPNTAK